ncbi:unnamed protein product [Eruca vesicaria subsp. sativa]|uniref:Uncharacterized protein n=1 Tax=Eruca vesicaria subsp. sativa TaxID=29727 RepID=A0ABC8JU65_ERUVS|nr:unnamed protein product [Eruca vesicaria subsp. sativa]
MEDVVVISRSIVRPSRDVNQSKEIHLTPWDLFLLNLCYLQRGLLFAKPDPSFDLISRLKASLSVALDHFYPFAGRLVKTKNDDGTVSFLVNCDGSGVEFVHASALNIELSDVLQYSGSNDGLFPANGIKSYQGESNPLLMVQVTEMKDGVFIGFGYNHTVADDKSLWMFINAWSEICSKDTGGGSTTPMEIILPGWFLNGIHYPIRIPDPETKFTPITSTTSNLQQKVFHLTKENILKLKAKANSEAGSDDLALDKRTSSLQAVLGHMWRSTVRNSVINREEETHCRVPADMRLRLDPPLEKECFGNVCQTGIVTTTVEELLDQGLGWAALQINKMVGLQKNETFKAFAENWLKNDKNSVRFGSNSLVVTSSPWFKLYSNDFGWGKPITARAGPPYPNGRLVVFQGAEEGSLDLQVCLPSQVLVNLSKDVEFLEYVC